MLDREVMTLGCSEQGLHINIQTHTQELCGTSGGRWLPSPATAAVLSASYLFHIMSTSAHTASWVTPAACWHGPENKQTQIYSLLSSQAFAQIKNTNLSFNFMN